MKLIIIAFVLLGFSVYGSPTSIVELKKENLGDSSFSFKVGRVIPESDDNPELVYILTTFPTSIQWGETKYALSGVEIEDQAFMHETSVKLSSDAFSAEITEVRFRVQSDAVDDTLISAVYGNGSFYYKADLGVILGDELGSEAASKKRRKQYRDELIRVLPDSVEAYRKVEYLKRNSIERLLLNHRNVQESIELIVDGTGLEVDIAPSLDELEINLSLKGLNRYQCLTFTLLQINARSIIDDRRIKIEPLPIP